MKNLNEQKMHSNIKRGIKMKVMPEQSRKIQDICFENDIEWFSGRNIEHLDEPFLFIDKYISFMNEAEGEYFLKRENEEVSAELFIRTNGTCVESETLTEDNDKGEQMEELKLECLVEGYEGTYFEIGQVWLTAQGSEKVKIIQLNVDTTVLVEGKIRYSVQLNGKFNKSGLESLRDLARLISTETPTEPIPSEEPQPKTLSEYLKENNAYETFVENSVGYFLENEDTYKKFKENRTFIDISNVFIWEDTKPSLEYWVNLSMNKPKNLRYDMNEIIFAEVDNRIAEQKAPTEPTQPEFISTEEFNQMFEQKTTTKYMVFVEGKNTPRYIHETKASAETEAKRLSTKMIGSKVSVVEIVKEFKSKVIVEEV